MQMLLLTLLIGVDTVARSATDEVCKSECGIENSRPGVAMLQMKSSTKDSRVHESSKLETWAIEASQSLNHVLQRVASKSEPGHTRKFLEALRLCAPCKKFERLGEEHDGGYVMCMDGLDEGLVGAYSYGISGYDGAGMAIASTLHIPLFEYDCTNPNEPTPCAGCTVKFHNECIMEHDGASKQGFKTLSQQLQESGNGDAPERSLILKIDVEDAEWQVFAKEPVENLRKFRQIVVEYHSINKKELHPLYEQAAQKIEEAGLSVAHIHGNNYGGGLEHFGEYSIPNVIEVTYIQTPAEGCSANIPYHVPQDRPNAADAPEIPDANLPQRS